MCSHKSLKEHKNQAKKTHQRLELWWECLAQSKKENKLFYGHYENNEYTKEWALVMDRNSHCQDYFVRDCQIRNQNSEQDPSSIINTPVESFTEEFTCFCGIMNPELPSQPVRPSRNAYSFGPLGRDLGLIQILQVLSASHKDLH